METGRIKYVWPTMMVLSLIIIGFNLLFMSVTELVFETTMERTGSSMTWESLDEETTAALRFFITESDRRAIWFGILGLFCAWGIKRKESFAWKLGAFWGVMLLVNGILLGGYELLILGWSTVCMATYELIIVGVIALGSLLIVKKEFPTDVADR